MNQKSASTMKRDMFTNCYTRGWTGAGESACEMPEASLEARLENRGLRREYSADIRFFRLLVETMLLRDQRGRGETDGGVVD